MRRANLPKGHRRQRKKQPIKPLSNLINAINKPKAMQREHVHGFLVERMPYMDGTAVRDRRESLYGRTEGEKMGFLRVLAFESIHKIN